MQDIVTEYFNRGFLLTPEALELIAKEQDDFEIASGGFVLDKNSFITRDRIKILKNFTEKKSEVTTEDFVKFYTSKYEKMKNIILSRIQKDFISLNKTDSMRSDAYIIGIVREIREDGSKKVLELEDMTTNIPVIFDGPAAADVEIDDVIAVHAITGGKVLFGKEVLFPDIPIRSPTQGTGKACFVSDLHLEAAPEKEIERFFSWFDRSDIKNLFVAGDIGDRNSFQELAGRNNNKSFFVIPGEKDGADYPQTPMEFTQKNITSLSNPALVEMNGIKILITHNMSPALLKKRHIGKPTSVLSTDYMALEEVPDIVHFGHSHTPQIINYKSVTMVNSGSLLSDFKPVIIDFASRDAKFAKVE
ncbi:MAG: metallophosphoesterase family protein [Candidatus Aenigmarchaeota archaeon]|nr:metallophosphoesterase family protein [Candidatus Aenigmarchaeota archaeon]